MSKAVQYDRYGDIDVLEVREVPRPTPGDGEVLIVDAFLDFFGGGYVELAVTELGVDPQRVDTIIDFPAIERLGVKGQGNADAADATVLAELADLIAAGELEVAGSRGVPA
jgi:hypothetical protein